MRTRKMHQTDHNSPDDSTSDDDMAFQELLGDHLMKWDASITAPVPALDTLEQLVIDQKQLLTRRIWRDLLLLWVIGGFIISGMLLLLQHNTLVFALVQAGSIVAAAIFLILTLSSKSEEGSTKWTN